MTVEPIIPIVLMVILSLGLGALCVIGVKDKWKIIRRVAMILMLFMINLQMEIPGNSPKVKITSTDAYVLFVVDDTISMVANDYAGSLPQGVASTRLNGMKADCDRVIEGLLGAKFGVVTFNNSAYINSPFTDNITHVSSVISAMYPLDSSNARGTTLNIAKQTMGTVLKDVQEKKDKKVIVFFLSDGEITNGDTLESFLELRPYIAGGAVLGYGSATGGTMTLYNAYYESEEVITDYYTGDVAVSRIDEGNLKSIASDLGVEYYNMNNGQSLDSLLSRLVRENNISYDIETTVDVTGEYTDDKPVYFVFVIILLGLLSWEFVMLRRRR